MSKKDDIRKFLVARRANITLAEAGLPDFGDERRVPGLRREEAAQLAGVSVDYYTRLERGNIHGASESVLNAIARALHLTDVEREHLLDLARLTPSAADRRTKTTAAAGVRPSVQRVLDNLAMPAVVYNARQDLVASNLLGRALFSLHFDSDRPNMARFIFLDSRAKDYYADWPLACSLTAAMLRYEAGRAPLNAEITELIGELATRSLQFRKDWADQDVHEHRTGQKAYAHPEVGTMDLTYDVFEMPGEPGLSIATFTPDEGSESADRLILLASWAATQEFDSTMISPDS
ncbi:helix-turn-helix transcriptional regulator [Paenarthrobacter sp. RAF54_2]|uniref:helix-turn-helix transcriptional regulator n=1 Tax=Paenarthrobacter sp. RAF54_2 TaxID=3233061 RepID=UPI003F9B7A3E